MINRIKNRGFTLIETLVAVLILATAIAGPLTIASKGLSTALVAKNQVIGYYLAQDAMEFVRFKRDTNQLCLGAGQSGGACAGVADWLSGLDGGCFSSPNGCNIDSISGTITACTPSCAPLKFNEATNTYTTNGAILPAFTRVITITQPIGANADEARVVVTVSWSDIAGVTHPPIIMTEDIFKWQ